MEFTFLKNALIQVTFTNGTPYSKFVPKFLPSRPKQKEITYSPRQHSFKNLFLPTAEKGGETMICFIKIQSKNMYMTWNIRFFIFCMICSFFKCDGFTVL